MATYASLRYDFGTQITGTIPTAAIADDAVTAAKIADNAVVTAAINADAVTDAKIADDVVGSEHLTAGEVDTTALGADSVTAAKIGDNVLNSEHYAAASIDNEHLADDAVGVAELSASGTASSDTFLRGDNSWAGAGGGFISRTSGSIGGNLACASSGYQDHTASFSSPAGAAGGIVHCSFDSDIATGNAYLRSVSGGTASSTDRSLPSGVNLIHSVNGIVLGVGRHTDTLFFGCGASESLTLTFAVARGSGSGVINLIENFQFSVVFFG